MKIVYKVLAVLCATAVMVVSVVWFVNEEGNWRWASALCITWFILAWVASMNLFLHFRLPDWYYRAGNFEKSGRIYEQLGVLHFRKLVRRGPIHILAPALQYSGQREFLSSMERETCIAETIHLIAFLPSLLLVVFSIYKGWLNSIGWFLLFNVFLNGYPLVLQRYNRERLKKLLQKIPAKQQQ